MQPTKDLSEAKRKEVFKAIASAEARSEADAKALYPIPSYDDPDYSDEKYNEFLHKQQQAAYDLDIKYKSDVAGKYGLTLEQMIWISVEGIKNSWPGCWETSGEPPHGVKPDPEKQKQDWELFQQGVVNDKVEVVGVYPLDSGTPCSLVELIIHDCGEPQDLMEFRQEKPTWDIRSYQVPYLEHVLDRDGVTILADDYTLGKKPELWKGDVRLVFFLHFLDPFLPLKTPLGYVLLPEPNALPDRLKMIKYEPVD